jgi:hypothetical protein
MESKHVALMVIANCCLILGLEASAAPAGPETVLQYERGLTATEVADFEAMRQSLPRFKRGAVEALLPWLPKTTDPLPLYDSDIPNSKAAPDLESRSRLLGMETLVLLKYRLPDESTMLAKSIGPLQDAQQALRQVRRHADDWGIDPHRVGVMGFSAGGHLAATLGTHFDTVLVPQ